MPRPAAQRNVENVEAYYTSQSLTDIAISSLVRAPKWDSIIDFATHRSFCGKTLYPKQKTLLRLVYLETEQMTAFDVDTIDTWARGFGQAVSIGVQPDIWQRVDSLKTAGYRHFPHVQLVLGRRASKGLTGGIIGAEKIAYLVSLDDPQEYYGIEPGKEIYLPVIATTETNAKRNQFGDIRRTVEGCAYLRPFVATNSENALYVQTPADMRRIAAMIAERLPLDREVSTIRCLPIASTSSSGRGFATYMNCLDPETPVLTADLR